MNHEQRQRSILCKCGKPIADYGAFSWAFSVERIQFHECDQKTAEMLALDYFRNMKSEENMGMVAYLCLKIEEQFGIPQPVREDGQDDLAKEFDDK